MTPGVWFDWDQAQCALVVGLGLYDPGGPAFGPAKWVFAARNPVGDALAALLDALAAAAVLEKNDDDQFRIRVGYDPGKFGEIKG